jgi:hypothetical protein
LDSDEKGAVNLGKMVPFLGGVIGGTIDAVATNIIGNVARDTLSGAAEPTPSPADS